MRNAVLVVVGVIVALGVIGALSRPAQPVDAPGASPTFVAQVSPTPPLVTVPPTAIASSPPSPPPTPSIAPATVAPPTAVPPTSAPTAVPPTPAPVLLESESGRGDKVLRIEAQDLPTVARISNRGQSNFSVVSYIGGEYDDLLVNKIGRYDGMVYLAPGVDTLEITSSGQWSIERSFLDGATLWDGASDLTGEGDSVVVLTGGSFGATTISYRGSGNFAVIAYSEFGDYLDLLVNEIGNYEGEVLLPSDDPVVLAIQAVGGSWSMSAVE